MMRKSTHFHLLGLGFFFSAFVLVFAAQMHGQVLPKAVKEITNTVTAPMNTTQQATKEVVAPIKEVRTEVKTMTNAPKEITREIDQTKKGFESAENEVERAKSDVEKLTGTGDKNKGNEKDSTAAKTAGNDEGKPASEGNEQEKGGKYVPPDYVPANKTTPATATKASGIDPKDVPRPVPPGSRDNKTPSGPMPLETAVADKAEPDQGVAPKSDPEPMKVSGTDPESADRKVANANPSTVENSSSAPVLTNPAAEYKSVSIPPSNNAVDPANSNSGSMNGTVANGGASEASSAASANASSNEQEGSRYVALTPVAGEGTKRPKPDYSLSPARIALEKAEFDIETLEQLFKYSNWEGLEREHTVRAVEYALNEMQVSIVEIKKLDPGFSTWRFEERYKEMRAAYQKAKQP